MATSMDGGNATTVEAPIVSGGSDPVSLSEIAPVADPHSVAGDYHFIEADMTVEATTHFGGHPMFLNIPAAIAVDNSLVYVDTETDRDVLGSVINTDISAHLPTGLATPNAAIVISSAVISTSEHKVALNTIITAYIYYSLVYDVNTGSNWHVMNHFSLGSQSNAADNVALKSRVSSQAMVPVVYSGGVPYITWFSRLIAQHMWNESGLYGIANHLYLVGLLK